MSLETQQVKLRLTNDKEVLKALKKKRALKTDERGEKFVVQFDSKSFEFRPGRTITVGKIVANGLRRSSSVIIGDDLTGDIMPVLEVVDTYSLGEEDAGRNPNICPVDGCGVDCKSLIGLSRHLAGPAHKKDRDTSAPPKEADETDWEAQVAEAEKVAAELGANEAAE